ncbi:gephyrin-like molybdotransferase Glp [Proteinivorax tanatarense]|uniref:Molybdopterin molybdenumtransferase n=1 Tax=Proteinivorax tanatarense TaxID=1260629 RepID=A0AAU7VKR9_9FIRM
MAFLNVKSVEEVYKVINSFKVNPGEQIVDIVDAVGKTLAEDIYSPYDLPQFNRSAVDGYAVRWEDVSGASESLPSLLEVIERLEMGTAPTNELKPGSCVEVPTGGMLPKNADSVVMVEYTENFSDHEVGIHKSVASGENVIIKGEDIKKGEVIMNKGDQVLPESINLLSSLGVTKVSIVKPVRVGIISTGDELVETGEEWCLGEIPNSNGPGLMAACKLWGGIPEYYGIVKDQFNDVKSTLKKAVNECEIVLLTGGTSVGKKDYVAEAIESIGTPGVLIHGIALKPGKPTIIGQIDNTPVFGLSGNPVSAMLCFKLFVRPLLNNYTEEKTLIGYLNQNIPSAGGRQDYVPVKVNQVKDKIEVKPLFAKSNSIGVLTKMDGYIIVPIHSEGLAKGEKVKIYLKERG